ncbi:glutathione S-transferase family protein [Chthonobacter rhizosphaerae]|uniref:glutathione S-transferase family protein n=1 Tax=Chthonobacter rhizosphaerae TaxID=2735553 RepID=UPI0015EF40E8|nr:glutathione S-transferase family protein [Chthonobacter rhizosphaerae]
MRPDGSALPVLHDWELSAGCYAVRLMASLLGVAYHKALVDVHPGGETEGAAFRALNPRGTVPVWVEGPLVIGDTVAILGHLAATRDPSGAWLPREGAAFARTLDWLAFAARRLPAADTARLHAMAGLATGMTDAAGAAREAFRALDDHLARQAVDGHGFLAGPTPTVADIACFPSVALGVDFGEALERSPKLRAWTRRIRALPGFVTTPGVPEFL